MQLLDADTRDVTPLYRRKAIRLQNIECLWITSSLQESIHSIYKQFSHIGVVCGVKQFTLKFNELLMLGKNILNI